MTPETETRGAHDERAAVGLTEFTGYGRADGRIGVRNRLLVLPSVICSHIVADRIAERVPTAVSAPHDHGCAQLGADNDQTARTFTGIGTNPNVAGVVVVGLGCEEIQSGDVAAELVDFGVPVRELSIQSEGGSDRTIERGVKAATALLDDQREKKTTGSLADLTLGIVGSDVQESTLETADPLVGSFARRVVDVGGRVVVAGTERLSPHAEEAVAAADTTVRAELGELLETRRRTPARTAGLRRRAAERSFDELSRPWDGLPIREVLAYGERATHDAGVALVDAPSGFAEAATGLAAAGAQLVLHSTAEGIPSGHPIVPVLKVTGDERTYRALPEDIDVDARATTPEGFTEYVLDVLDGTESCAERHGLTEFAITRVGPSM
jgi:altronate dehydratase large subunit